MIYNFFIYCIEGSHIQFVNKDKYSESVLTKSATWMTWEETAGVWPEDNIGV